MRIYFLVFAAICIFAVHEARADCGHGNNPCEVPVPGPQGPPGPAGPAGIAGVAGTSNVDIDSFESNYLSGYADEDYVNSVTAGFMAVSQIDFSSSTSKWQIGVGAGYYESENAVALGVGKLLPNHDILLKGTITSINSENAYGAGLMWKLP